MAKKARTFVVDSGDTILNAPLYGVVFIDGKGVARDDNEYLDSLRNLGFKFEEIDEELPEGASEEEVRRVLEVVRAPRVKAPKQTPAEKAAAKKEADEKKAAEKAAKSEALKAEGEDKPDLEPPADDPDEGADKVPFDDTDKADEGADAPEEGLEV